MEYERLSGKAIKLMYITQTISSGLLLLIPGIVLFVWLFFFEGSRLAACLILGVCAALFAVSVAIFPRIRFRRYRYLISVDRIEVIEGIFWVNRSVVPIDRIHQIDIKTGPLDNAVGVAKVIVTTAGSAVVFRFLEPDRANEIAMHLNDVLNKVS